MSVQRLIFEARTQCLEEALSVDDGGPVLVVFRLVDPYPTWLTYAKRAYNRAADPGRALSLRRGDDLNVHRCLGEGCDLFLQAVDNAREHGRSSGQDNVGVQVITDVDVAPHDGVVNHLVEADRGHAKARRLEHRLGAAEPLVTDRYRLQHAELSFYYDQLSVAAKCTRVVAGVKECDRSKWKIAVAT